MANYYRYQLRGATQEAWNEANPVLTKNEPGYDQTNNRLKFGDGTTPWNELPYLAPDVVDDLLSLSTTSALSAAQGRELKTLIDNIPRDLVTQDNDGLMSAEDKRKLDGIAKNANAYVHPITAGNKHIPIGGSYKQILRYYSSGTAVWDDEVSVIDNLTSTDAEAALSANQGRVLDETKLNRSEVVNNLTSMSTTSALSAAQGKVLDDTKLNKSDVINNLASTSATAALSAAQGKNLNDIKLNKGDVVNNLTSTNTAAALSAAQGKFLNDNKLNKSDVIDNLMSASTTSALSAAQGKVLKELIDNAPTGITSVTVNDVSGNWPLNRVSGTLGVGNMDINGLKSNLQSWGEGLGGGVSSESISANGYLKFKNGLMIEWGTIPAVDNDTHNYDVKFHTPFSNACFCLAGCVVDSTNRGTGSDGASHNFGNMITMRVKSLSKTGFTLYLHYFERRYIAIGY